MLNAYKGNTQRRSRLRDRSRRRSPERLLRRSLERLRLRRRSLERLWRRSLDRLRLRRRSLERLRLRRRSLERLRLRRRSRERLRLRRRSWPFETAAFSAAPCGGCSLRNSSMALAALTGIVGSIVVKYFFSVRSRRTTAPTVLQVSTASVASQLAHESGVRGAG